MGPQPTTHRCYRTGVVMHNHQCTTPLTVPMRTSRRVASALDSADSTYTTEDDSLRLGEGSSSPTQEPPGRSAPTLRQDPCCIRCASYSPHLEFHFPPSLHFTHLVIVRPYPSRPVGTGVSPSAREPEVGAALGIMWYDTSAATAAGPNAASAVQLSTPSTVRYRLKAWAGTGSTGAGGREAGTGGVLRGGDERVGVRYN